MGVWPFRRSRAEQDAERLLATVILASRAPAFFGEGRVPDTLVGRLDVLTLHAGLVFIRLEAAPELAPLGQCYADRLFRHIDEGLREAGVGDLAVAKHMRRIAGAFYGRIEVYAGAVKAGNAAALAAALAGNLSLEPAFAAALGRYMLDLAAKQARLPSQALFQSDAWDGAPM